MHIDTSGGESEHEETVFPNGDVRDIYPDHTDPHEIIFHRHEGGITDMLCLNVKCTNATVQITRSSILSDGTYQWLQTDDPKIVMVRDREGFRVLGYIATNHGGVAQSFPDLPQAQAFGAQREDGAPEFLPRIRQRRHHHGAGAEGVGGIGGIFHAAIVSGGRPDCNW